MAAAMMDFRNEIGDHVVGLHQGAEFLAAARFNIKLRGNVCQPFDERIGIGIAVYIDKSLIDRQIMAVGRGTENAVYRMIEECTIAGLACRHARARIFGHARQQHQAKTQHRQNDQPGDELPAEVRHQPDANHQPRHEKGKRARQAGTVAAVFLHGIGQRRHVAVCQTTLRLNANS